MNNAQFVIILLSLAFSVMLTRYLPFVLFKDFEQLPDLITYLGKVLPAAMMGFLVVYCFKDYHSPMEVLSALAAAAAVSLTYVWKRNVVISILSGTIFYMILIRLI